MCGTILDGYRDIDPPGGIPEILTIQARSQPARWGGGGSELGWVEHQAHPPPPLDIVRVTSSIWKTPPLLDIHKHPPLDIVRVASSTYSKGGTKLLKGGTKLLKGGTKLLKGGTKLLKGGTKLLKAGTKLLKGGTKLLKGGTKLLKGGTKSLGWATGGVVRPPPPPTPPGYGPAIGGALYTLTTKLILGAAPTHSSKHAQVMSPPDLFKSPGGACVLHHLSVPLLRAQQACVISKKCRGLYTSLVISTSCKVSYLTPEGDSLGELQRVAQWRNLYRVACGRFRVTVDGGVVGFVQSYSCVQIRGHRRRILVH